MGAADSEKPIDLKGLEGGSEDAIAAEYDYTGLDEKEIALREKERMLNKDLDERIAKNPHAMPRAIMYIIPNEFGERFTYYGISAIVNSYFRAAGADQATAKILTSVWKMITYWFPLVGAALSDSFLGKYKTIVYLSGVYLAANLVLMFTSIPQFRSLFTVSIGLYMLAFGTGGIKPCVGPHGADQFLKVQADAMRRFWAFFYISINAGACLTGFITPALRDNTQCFGDILRGKPVCYMAGFALPTVTFAIAYWLFVYGEKFYRVVPPVGYFVPKQIFLVIVDAFGAFIKGKRPESGKSFFTLGSARYGEQFALEVAEWWNVFLQIFPISLTWMVYDQQNTEWANQYDRMNQFYFGFLINPDVFIGVVNPVMIVLMLWFLANVVYPALDKRGIKVTPLRRMGLGCLLVTIAFAWSGILQGIILANFNGKLDKDGMQDTAVDTCTKCVSGLWQLPQWFLLSLGEAFFSPTGNEFAYTQVSKTMKSTMSSFWLALVGLGNLYITSFEAAVKTAPWSKNDDGDSLPAKYYVYSAVSLASNIWFIAMAMRYKYKPGSEY